MDENPERKEVVVAGCKVTLEFTRTKSSQWSVGGTVQCGAGEKTRVTSFHIRACASRASAEEQALAEASALIGNNTPAGDEAGRAGRLTG